MDQHNSRPPHGRPRNAQDATPIYDRLLAEWQAARNGPEPAPHGRQVRRWAGSRVPAARTSGEPPLGGW